LSLSSLSLSFDLIFFFCGKKTISADYIKMSNIISDFSVYAYSVGVVDISIPNFICLAAMVH
jgi:hypothetical protein